MRSAFIWPGPVLGTASGTKNCAGFQTLTYIIPLYHLKESILVYLFNVF